MYTINGSHSSLSLGLCFPSLLNGSPGLAQWFAHLKSSEQAQDRESKKFTESYDKLFMDCKDFYARINFFKRIHSFLEGAEEEGRGVCVCVCVRENEYL